MNKFLKYYSDEIKRYGGLNNYIIFKSIEKKPLLDRIRKYAKNKKEILEAGCGSAANSIFLANNGFNVICIDNNPEILKFARSNSSRFENSPIFLKKDILRLPYLNKSFDVSFSHGVLEHYADNKIIDLINSQLSVAQFVIVSVPSNFFKQKEAVNGDERFLDKKYWIKLISKTNGELVEIFSYFYDSDKLKIHLLKLISFLTLNKLPKTKPYIGFVIKRK